MGCIQLLLVVARLKASWARSRLLLAWNVTHQDHQNLCVVLLFVLELVEEARRIAERHHVRVLYDLVDNPFSLSIPCLFMNNPLLSSVFEPIWWINFCKCRKANTKEFVVSFLASTPPYEFALEMHSSCN